MDVHLYSDGSGEKSRGDYYVVAGVAVSQYRDDVRRQLAEAIASSGIQRDWRSSSSRCRRAFLDRALAIAPVRGRVFFEIHRNVRDGYWGAIVGTLERAGGYFAPNHLTVITHEGLTRPNRERMARYFKGKRCGPDERGSFHVPRNSSKHLPEIRLADSLACVIAAAR